MTSMVMTLAENTVLVGIGAFLFFLVSLIMIGVILIQKPKGGGLSGAFGGGAGGGSSSAVLGARAGDVLTWFTIGCFVAFLLLGVLLVYGTDPESFWNNPGAAAVETEEVVEETPAITPEEDTKPEGGTEAAEGTEEVSGSAEVEPTDAPAETPAETPATQPAAG